MTKKVNYIFVSYDDEVSILYINPSILWHEQGERLKRRRWRRRKVPSLGTKDRNTWVNVRHRLEIKVYRGSFHWVVINYFWFEINSTCFALIYLTLMTYRNRLSAGRSFWSYWDLRMDSIGFGELTRAR